MSSVHVRNKFAFAGFILCMVVLLPWTYQRVKVGLVETLRSMDSDFFTRWKSDTLIRLCHASAPMPQIETCLALGHIFTLFDDLCKKYETTWFAWGEFALQLLNGCFNSDANSNLKEFEVYLAATDEAKIGAIWSGLSKTVTNWSSNFTCINNGPAMFSDACTLITTTPLNLKVYIRGPSLIDFSSNELLMKNKALLRQHIFKLNRFLPLKYANFYEIKIPIPNDPIFVFSHVIPSRDEIAKETYVYGQGCENLHSELRQCQNIKAVKSESTTASGFLFSDICNITKDREVFVPLHILVHNTKLDQDLRFEDFPDVIPLERGNGSYNLKRPERKTWSQYGQDKWLDNYFKNRTNGFFLEVGGYDGETFSNTLMFEKYREWDGILVEAIPDLYKLIKSRNRKCYMLNACISDTLEKQAFVYAGALSSSDVAMTERHKNRIYREKAQKYPTKEVVHCKSLLQIMDAIGARKIDYFSLDVEGGELIILNSIPWDLLDIELFTIETDQHRNKIIQFMESKGYERIQKLKGDDIFRKAQGHS